MKALVCNLNLFDGHQKIYLFNDETGDSQFVGFSDMDHLAEILISYCADQEVYDIHFFGNRSFAKDIAEDIVTLNQMNYSNFTINVEVN